MANRYYASGEERAAKVKELFGAIATRYDLINDFQSFGLHRRWKKRLVRLAGFKPGERALDLCCGTGDVAFAMIDSGAEVFGLDFSLPMLMVASRKAHTLHASVGRQNHSEERRKSEAASANCFEPLRKKSAFADLAPISFLRGDAMRIPFCDAQFDVVTISYGLRNLADPQTGLTEMWRVLRPGGRLLVLDFGKPENASWRALYFAYLRWCVPGFGRFFCGDRDSYAYILESLAHYPGQRGIADLMQRMSFSDVRVIDFLGGVMSINYGVKGTSGASAVG